MTVVVRNERLDDFWVHGAGGGSSKRAIAPDEIMVISDVEWESVPSSMRGPGGLNPLYPNEISSTISDMRFDYYDVAGTSELRYIGTAAQGSATDADVWTIKQFSHTTIAGENVVEAIQVRQDVNWDDRDSLDWN